MSVFTTVHEQELKSFIQGFPVGSLVSYAGISAGVENTNYFVTTELAGYVLTLFEKHTAEELPFYIDLMSHLATKGIPAPLPIKHKEGYPLRELNTKPAILITRLSGGHYDNVNEARASEVGKVMGQMHVATQDFTQRRRNSRDLEWQRDAVIQLRDKLSAPLNQLLAEELEYLTEHSEIELPKGVIHADLFKDNVMFEGDDLTGVIDFYFACYDNLLYDLAVAVNEWCMCDEKGIDQSLLNALISAYHAERPLTDIERQYWPVMLRAAAMRFWVSRLMAFYFPVGGDMVLTKNPEEFERKLLLHRESTGSLVV